MKTTFQTVSCLCFLFLSTAILVGCSGGDESARNFALNEPAGGDADVEEDESWKDDPNHPPHGTRGGHMYTLSNDKTTEIHFDEGTSLFSVYIDGLGDVSAVQMTTTIDGQDTVYEFERTDTPGGSIYGLLSEDLGAAVMMDQDQVQTKVLIKTADGDLTADFVHYPH